MKKSATCSMNSSIYSNVYEEAKKHGLPFNIFIGGRGIGKTYSALKGFYQDKKPIVYFRTTGEMMDTVGTPETNPYKSINLNEGLQIKACGIKGGYVFKNEQNEELVGYGFGLSTFYKMRGASFPEVKGIVYDEFLADGGEYKVKGLANKFFQAYETINRNREAEGDEPVQAFLLANAFSIDSNLLRDLNLVEPLVELLDKPKKEQFIVDRERGIYLHILDNKAVSDVKQNGALYRLTKGTSFYDLALKNEFIYDTFFDVKKVNFNELTPLVSVGNITFYHHKSKELLYVAARKAQCPSYTKANFDAFLKEYRYYIKWFVSNGLILYQNYAIKLISNNILGGEYID